MNFIEIKTIVLRPGICISFKIILFNQFNVHASDLGEY